MPAKQTTFHPASSLSAPPQTSHEAMRPCRMYTPQQTFANRTTRVVVAAVFIMNVYCAFQFIVFPQAFVGGFELSGTAGNVALQGLGIAFLMWNATYPLVIKHPARHRVLFSVVLVQQAIGLVGETWLFVSLPPGHEALAGAIGRFIVCDLAAFICMTAAFIGLTFAFSRRFQTPRDA